MIVKIERLSKLILQNSTYIDIKYNYLNKTLILGLVSFWNIFWIVLDKVVLKFYEFWKMQLMRPEKHELKKMKMICTVFFNNSVPIRYKFWDWVQQCSYFKIRHWSIWIENENYRDHIDIRNLTPNSRIFNLSP